MKKNVVFLVCVKSENQNLIEKHGNFQYFEYSKKTWEYWCKRNNVELFIYESPSEKDTEKYRATWTRWFDVFDQLDSANINYDKILVADGSIMVRWDCPNFFEFVNDDLVAFRAIENLKWVYDAIVGYSRLFNNYHFDKTKYIDCGFQIFTKKHKEFLDKLKKFYYSNFDEIKLYHDSIKKGTDQTPYNYLLQIEKIKVDVDLLPPCYMLNHLHRFDWFSHNWQLNKDNTPFFIKYGYIWKFSGFPQRSQRFELMNKTWNLIKDNYL